jgi:hypothetical protein
MFVILRVLGMSRLPAYVTLAFLAVSPHYLFWSRTFMIESTALFFAVTYLAFLALATKGDVVEERSVYGLSVCIALSGALAGLTKVTTFVPFMVAAGLLILYRSWYDWRGPKSRRNTIVLLVISALLLPALATYYWTVHADRLKNLNPMGQFLTSHMLERWTFGTIAQRLSLASYSNFAFMGFGHVLDNLVGSRFVILLSLLLLVGAGFRSLRMFTVCVALYVAAIAIFFNLHYIHSYYAYANGIFLIAAIGFCIDGALKRRGVRGWAAICVLAFAIGTCVTHYFHEYYELQKADAPGRPLAAAVIDKETKPTDAILVYGLEWSSELPYQAHRRAIMAWQAPGETALQRAIANQGASHISALIVCDKDRGLSPAIVANMRSAGFGAKRQLTGDNCDIYLP